MIGGAQRAAYLSEDRMEFMGLESESVGGRERMVTQEDVPIHILSTESR